jgi:dihydroorotase
LYRTLIRGGRVLDPASDFDGVADVLIEKDQIKAVGTNLSAPDSGLSLESCEVVDAEGRWVAPGFVDLHVHLREPGQEYKEDLASGGRAGVAGGFTALACMANTNPVNDDPSVTKYILDRAEKDSPARIYPIAAATRGLKGELMTEMAALREAGAVAFSDDGATIVNAAVMRRVLEYSRLVDAPIVIHAEDCGLRGDGVVNEGIVSTRLGLPGNPVEAEEILVARDIRLVRMTGARLHVAHVSAAGSIDLIRQARDEGLQVTAEVTPHHLSLTDEATLGFDTSTKMAPPLRSAVDVAAMRAALAEGVIDCIATDHAPHAEYEKDVEFTAAPCGVLGLETAYSVVMDLVRKGELSPLELVRRLTCAPARIFDLPCGTLAVGARADVVMLDPEARWTYDPAEGFSKSRNSPWAGEEFSGRTEATWVDGKLVYSAGRGVVIQ